MIDHTENTLRAAQKALTDVVGPALDPADPLAAEQLRLVVEYLDFVRNRLDDINDRVRADLLQAITIGRRGYTALDDSVLTGRLVQSVAEGERVVAQATAHPQDMKDAALAIHEDMTSLVRSLGEDDPEQCRVLQRVIVTGYKPMLDFERAWFLPFGFDPEPAKALSTEEALARLVQEYESERDESATR